MVGTTQRWSERSSATTLRHSEPSMATPWSKTRTGPSPPVSSYSMVPPTARSLAYLTSSNGSTLLLCDPGHCHRRGRRRRALECHEGDVVLLLPFAPGELSQLGEARLDEVLGSSAVLDDLLEAWKTEHVAGCIVRLDEAVAVEQNAVAGSEVGFVLLVGHFGHGTERHSGHAKLCDSVRRRHVGRVVPRVCVA